MFHYNTQKQKIVSLRYFLIPRFITQYNICLLLLLIISLPLNLIFILIYKGGKMGRNKISLNEDQKSFVKDLLNQNKTLENIKDELIEKYPELKIGIDTLRRLVKDDLEMKWNYSTRKWEPKSNTENDTQEKEVELPPYQEKNNNVKESNILLEELKNDISSVLTEIDGIRKDITEIKNILIKENPKKKITQIANDIVELYADKRERTSININTKILDLIKKLAEEKYGIKNNKSDAINTALLDLYLTKINENDES